MSRTYFKKTILVLIFIITWLLIIYLTTTFPTPKHLKYLKKEKTKYILYWTKMFDVDDFYLGMGSKVFQNCPVKNCATTNLKDLIPVEEFDAVLFHGVEYNPNLHPKPKNRSTKQVYIFVNLESPINTPDSSLVSNFYNWTMTYRLDSDVFRPYGYFEKTRTTYKPPLASDIQKRPKKIAWLVSNCNTASQREVLHDKLKKYLEIDTFGKCGKYSCAKSNMENCYDFLEKNYKFYLSFENSICQDYVTEKLYNVLKKNLIPIVYGGANYSKIAPPQSVIDVTKFESISAFVEFIKRLDENPEEYLKYFEWKRNYVVNTSTKRTLCSLCAKLNQPIEHKVYGDIFQWWCGGSSSSLCKIISKHLLLS